MISFSFRSYRPPEPLPNRVACNWMLISVISAFALHIPRLPLWLSIAAVGLLLWRYLVENHAWRIPARSLRWALLVICAVVVYRQFGTLFGHEAGVGFLILLIGLKVVEIKTLRDYLITMFLIYLLVMTQFLHSQSLTSACYALVVVLIATHTLVLLNRDTTGSVTQSVRLIGVMFLQALPLLLVLYFLFPRIQGSFWQTPLDSQSASTGMSEQVSPGSINKLYNDDTIAFRAEFTKSLPSPDQRYWRTFVLSESDGRTWRKYREELDILPPWQHQSTGGEAVEYTVILEPHYQNWVPALDLPLQPGVRTVAASGYTLKTKRKIRTRQRFNLASLLNYRTLGLSAAERVYNTAWATTPSKRVAELVRSWQTRASTPQQVVQLALQHFRTEPFRYTLTPPVLGADPIDEFMFGTQAGYCEHFASTFAALMRLAEIPTRLVVGYQGGQWNNIGQYLIVRQSDAHAWTEVWLAHQGWTRVDPTNAVAPERIELGANAIRQLVALGTGLGALDLNEARRLITPNWIRSLWSGVQLRWDAVNNAWNKRVIGYNIFTQRKILSYLGFRAPGWVATVATLGTSILVLMLLLAAMVLYNRRPRDPVILCYEKFCKRLKRVGIDRHSHEGPLAFTQRLLSLRPDLRNQAEAITKLYIALRYGKFNQEGLMLLRKHISAFKPSSSIRT